MSTSSSKPDGDILVRESKFSFSKANENVHVRSDIWQTCRSFTSKGNSLHGRMIHATFVSEARAEVTFIDDRTGQTMTKSLDWDGVRWSNLRNEDIRLEPSRREIYKVTRAKKRAALPQGTDERMKANVSLADNEDLAHQRKGFARW